MALCNQGFDIGEVPDDVLMPIPMPVCLDLPAHVLRPYNKMAKLALDVFNKKEVCALLVHQNSFRSSSSFMLFKKACLLL